jgi:hypothetical protein
MSALREARKVGNVKFLTHYSGTPYAFTETVAEFETRWKPAREEVEAEVEGIEGAEEMQNWAAATQPGIQFV